MKPQGSNANAWDANIDMIDAALDWSEKYLNDLEVIQANRKLIIEEARSLHFQDQGKVVELCKYIETYLLATNQRDCSIAHLEGDNLLKDVSETIGTLTKNLEERTSELESEYARQITAVVRKSSFSSQDLSDVLAICREYSVIIELHKKIPSLRVKQFYIDLIKLSFIDDEKVYDSLLQQYTAAETPEGFKKLQRVLEEEVLTPFEKTKKSLQEKYSWHYTFRFLPCFAEYRLIDVELPERWRELAEEVGFVLGNPTQIRQQKMELEGKTIELQETYDYLSRMELHLEYITRFHSTREKIETDGGFSGGTALYLKDAAGKYQDIRSQLEKLFVEADRCLPLLFLEELRAIKESPKDFGHQGREEMRAALDKITALEQKAIACSLNGSVINKEITSAKYKWEKALQAYQDFSTLADLEERAFTFLSGDDQPAGKEIEKRVAWALLAGRNYHHQPLSGDIWQRTAALGIRENEMVDLMALAYDAGVLPAGREIKTAEE